MPVASSSISAGDFPRNDESHAGEPPAIEATTSGVVEQQGNPPPSERTKDSNRGNAASSESSLQRDVDYDAFQKSRKTRGLVGKNQSHEKSGGRDDDMLEKVLEKDDASSVGDDEEPAEGTSGGTEGAAPQGTIQQFFGSERRSVIETRAKMDNVRRAMGDSYQREGKKVLLHGYLHIQIIRGRKLRNLDCMRGCHNVFPSSLFLGLANNVSDPYVTVHAGNDRLIKTSTIFDNLNPEWNIDYFVPIAHPIESLEFRVKDWDLVSNELIGRAYLPVSDLIRFGSDGKLLRTGMHKVVHLDGRASNGAFEYYVEYIPKNMMHNKIMEDKGVESTMVVPGVYFNPRENNHVKLYINADDKTEERGCPIVTYGEGREKTWKPNRLWRDIYDSLCQAKHLIYIVGWSVDYRQSLLRGEECKDALNMRPDNKGHYSPYIGQLLQEKAEDGVNINLLVWDDQTSNTMLMDGVIGTRDEQLRQFFSNCHPNILLRLVPMAAGNSHLMKKLRQSVYYTHHQKCVIADTPEKELVAYVGGIDLTYGRYDDGAYPLFHTLKSVHKEDFHNACFPVSQEMGPREPWHDIHNCVQGPVVLDLLRNFEERWIGQGGLKSELTDLGEAGLSATARVVKDPKDAWSTQLFRSIDSRTAKMDTLEMKPISFDNIEGVVFDNEGKEQKADAKRERLMQKLTKTGKEYERSFIGYSVDGFKFTQKLHLKRETNIDNSVHAGLVHHIRNAQHFLYIESQYFLSSAFLWDKKQTSLCCNLIAAEITWKICEKIEAGERFAAYIVVPMWPEGLPEASSVQDILFYQYQTMQCMYIRIDAALKRRKEHLKQAGKEEELAGVGPSDYLNFYCLVNRETENSEDDQKSPSPKGVLNQTRRHPVYCHSKMTIVDDAIAIIGSANINQRSLDGNRDSELLLGAWQPAYMASKASVAQGEVHAFRMHCFVHLTGVMEDVFRNPSNIDCVRRVNEIAENTWELYVQEQVCDLKSYLAPYPIKVLEEGRLAARTSNGKFPDTDANILGANPSLPQYLTT